LGEGAHRARLAGRAEHAAAAEHARVAVGHDSRCALAAAAELLRTPAYLPVSKSVLVHCAKDGESSREREPGSAQVPSTGTD
jgi:hypothetical protein